jgi:hypothetical protein
MTEYKIGLPTGDKHLTALQHQFLEKLEMWTDSLILRIVTFSDDDQQT